jgi:crotonobetainyl-CoA:carnitine CoA-transferase CaiB-like acyl-CoA transferase
MSFGVKPIANSNMGKITLDLDLDLRDPTSREHFDSLLSTIDIFLDGYRPCALTRLGYGPAQLTELARSRNKGIIYIS